jgi:crotonobetainyl-CoA:carnitine CoA-transferase CaiB-like acyl-CoA transferase
MGAAVAPCNSGTQFLAGTHAVARGSFAHCDGADIPSNPVRLSSVNGGASPTVLEPAPTTGQHTDQILASVGIAAEELDDLKSSDIL